MTPGVVHASQGNIAPVEKHAREDVTRNRGLVGECEGATGEIFETPSPGVGPGVDATVIDARSFGDRFLAQVDDGRGVQGSRAIVFELLASISDHVERARLDIGAGRRRHLGRVLDQLSHCVLVIPSHHLRPAGSSSIELCGQYVAQLARQSGGYGNTPSRQVLGGARLSRQGPGDQRRLSLGRTDHLQLGLGSVPRVGDVVGEDRHPGHVGLSGAQRLDDSGVAGGNLGTQDQTRVLANEASQLVSAFDQRTLLHGWHEEHADHLFARGLQPSSTIHPPDEGDEHHTDEQPAYPRSPVRSTHPLASSPPAFSGPV